MHTCICINAIKLILPWSLVDVSACLSLSLRPARDAPDRCSTHFDAVAQIRGEAFFFKGKGSWTEFYSLVNSPSHIHWVSVDTAIPSEINFSFSFLLHPQIYRSIYVCGKCTVLNRKKQYTPETSDYSVQAHTSSLHCMCIVCSDPWLSA